MSELRRARQWLGTIVDIRVRGLAEPQALGAIEAAFREIASIHRLMSFHEPDSELSRMNREAARTAVRVDARTREVLALALEIARASEGRFDPTIAPTLVGWGMLPSPDHTPPPDDASSWRDVSIDGDLVSFTRALWLDLGGIAKGYAVDRATECLLAAGVTAGCINAGGDLRVVGTEPELIHVRTSGRHQPGFLPALQLSSGSMASSAGHLERRKVEGRWIGPHVDGRRRRAIGTRSIVSVIAERCAVADALTKVVLADRRFARHFLPQYEARALVHDGRGGWEVVGSP